MLLLKTTCAHGLHGNTLWDIHVTRSTPVSQLQYVRPAWHSTFDELREDADEQLFFSSSYNPNLVLRRFLTQLKYTDYNLRQRNLTLPVEVNAVIKRNFVELVESSDRM